MTRLIPAVGEETNCAYTFKMTNISVTSLEEALWHCYVNWRQSVDDYASPEFIEWLDEIGLDEIAERVRNLPSGGFAERYAAFLGAAGYFEKDKIAEVQKAAVTWERRLEWEKFKEQGDYLINNGEYEKACVMYRRACAFSPDDHGVYNNFAIALMKTGKYAEAERQFGFAREISPDDARLVLNLAECCVLGGKFEAARALLWRVERDFKTDETIADVYCFYGQIEFYQGNYAACPPYFEKALSFANEPHYVYCLADAYVKLRQYERALDTMSLIEVKDKVYLKKLSELYAAYDNIPAAIRCIEKALMSDNGSVDLWTRLAALHRKNYEPDKAASSITKALSLSRDNAKANLEQARIRKAQGRVKEYQTIMHKVLEGFKEQLRTVN